MNTSSRAGSYRDNSLYGIEYQSYVPKALPPNPNIKMTAGMKKLLENAHSQIGIMENNQSRISDTDSFVRVCLCQEAVASSYIEGIDASLKDVLHPPKDMTPDVEDTINCMKAMEYAISRSRTLPLCNRLIRETHKVLMSSKRGKTKYPGEFRLSQNWISGKSSAIEGASYIPPAPKDVVSAMDDLEAYLNADDEIDPLIRAALIHYQFEAIHPFLDGNGRVGRILITLFLMDKGIISNPILSPSVSITSHQKQYYHRLNKIRDRGNYEQWVKFFLLILAESAKNTITLQHEVNRRR